MTACLSLNYLHVKSSAATCGWWILTGQLNSRRVWDIVFACSVLICLNSIIICVGEDHSLSIFLGIHGPLSVCLTTRVYQFWENSLNYRLDSSSFPSFSVLSHSLTGVSVTPVYFVRTYIIVSSFVPSFILVLAIIKYIKCLPSCPFVKVTHTSFNWMKLIF